MYCGYYPYYQSAEHLFSRLSGSVAGLLDGSYFEAPWIPGKTKMALFSCDIPHYHRFINPHLSMNYHLSGYGLSRHEALTRLSGESVERYAGLVAAQLNQAAFRSCSHAAFQAENEEVFAADLLFIYEHEQRLGLAKKLGRSLATLDEHTPLYWTACASLYEEKRIWQPAQLFYNAFIADEPFIGLAVSTGTAAHRSFGAALCNSILEYVQIHQFNLCWYARLPAQRICGRSKVLEKIFKQFDLEKDYRLESYLCAPLAPLLPPTVCTFLHHRRSQMPAMLCGLQCDFNLERALLRSALEAHAIYYSVLYNGIEGRYMNSSDWPVSEFSDLDANVMYHAEPQRKEEKEDYYSNFGSEEITFEAAEKRFQALKSIKKPEEQIRWLLPRLKELDPQGCYQNITPPELAQLGWSVARCYFPQFLAICPPGYPPLQHPAYQRWSQGVGAYEPHPLP